jgi:type III secretory pathway component EscS
MQCSYNSLHLAPPKTCYSLRSMIKTNSFWIKLFFYLIVFTIVVALVVGLFVSLFNIETNIDTGNPIVAIMTYADLALFILSCIGFVVAVFVKLLKKLF